MLSNTQVAPPVTGTTSKYPQPTDPGVLGLQYVKDSLERAGSRVVVGGSSSTLARSTTTEETEGAASSSSGGASNNKEGKLAGWGKETPEETEKKALAIRLARARLNDPTLMLRWVAVYLFAARTIYTLVKRALTNVVGEAKAKLVGLAVVGAIALRKWSKHPRSVPRADDFWDFPIIGSAPYFALNKHRAHDVLLGMHRRNGFKTTELRVVNISMLFIMDPRDREYVLKTNFFNYTKNKEGDLAAFEYVLGSVTGRGIFSVDGREWQDQRKIASHMFSGDSLRSKMEKTFNEHADKLFGLLSEVAKSDKVVDIQDIFQSVIFDAFCDLAFGVEPNTLATALNGTKSEFLVAFDTAQNAVSERILLLPLFWHLERFAATYLGLPWGQEAKLIAAMKIITPYVTNIIQERKRETDLTGKEDLLSLYINHARKTNQPHILEDSYLFDTIVNFMIAGRDTTSVTLTNVFNFLAENPATQAKLTKVLTATFGQPVKGQPLPHVSWDASRTMPYADAVFNETLRMAPPVGNDFRIANEEDVLPSGVKVHPGARVWLANLSIGRDPSLWSNPDTFHPERWIAHDEATGAELPVKRVDEYVHPVFFSGKRLCLGKDMARFETIVFLAKILGRLEIRPVPGQYPEGADKYCMTPVIFFKNGLKVRVYEAA